MQRKQLQGITELRRRYLKTGRGGRTEKRYIKRPLLAHFILIERRIVPRPVERLARVGVDRAACARAALRPPVVW